MSADPPTNNQGQIVLENKINNVRCTGNNIGHHLATPMFIKLFLFC